MQAMTTQKITLDDIEKFLWNIAGSKIDAAQMDAVRVLIETYSVQMTGAWDAAPAEAAEAHMASLASLASQLLDTGGRMRLDPAGQLEEPGNPVATRRDMTELARKMTSVSAAVTELKESLPAARQEGTLTLKALDSAEERLAGQMTTVREALRALQDWYNRDAAAPPAVRDIRETRPAEILTSEDRATVTRVLGAARQPGCFLNPDGTITCKTCGLPKDTSGFYRDKQARTGFKSQCKDCERSAKQRAA